LRSVQDTTAALQLPLCAYVLRARVFAPGRCGWSFVFVPTVAWNTVVPSVS